VAPEPIALTVALCAGLFPALLLFRRYKRRFGRAGDLLINLAGGFAAMLPVALTRLAVVDTPLGLYAVTYFPIYLAGLLVFNWRQQKLPPRSRP